MIITGCPKNRIKPKQLREQKTEALLIFIRTTLEQYFKDLENQKEYMEIGSSEDTEILNTALKTLLLNLQKYVVNSTYIRTVISQSNISRTMKLLAKKEEPVMVYYNSIVLQIEQSLSQGQNWIPEQLVICLLSEWIIEEEKSILLYPFLNDINYLELLNRYDKIRIEAKAKEDWNKTVAIMNMYKVGNELIYKLKNISYKINTQRVSKSRKKR